MGRGKLALVHLVKLAEGALDRPTGAAGGGPARCSRLISCPAGPQRLRQVHAASRDRGFDHTGRWGGGRARPMRIRVPESRPPGHHAHRRGGRRIRLGKVRAGRASWVGDTSATGLQCLVTLHEHLRDCKAPGLRVMRGLIFGPTHAGKGDTSRLSHTGSCSASLQGGWISEIDLRCSAITLTATHTPAGRVWVWLTGLTGHSITW